MKNRLISLAAGLALYAGAVHCQAASDQSASAWEGVWEGTVGNVPVRVCLQGDDTSYQGAYYYLKYLRLISLAAAEGKSGARAAFSLTETDDSGKQTITWALRAGTGRDALAGTWSSASKTLPIALKRVPMKPAQGQKDADPGYACGSDEFNAAREAPFKVQSSAAKIDGTRYRLVSVDFAKRADHVVKSFQLERADQGARQINEKLMSQLKDNYGSALECTRTVLGQLGADGEYSDKTAPLFITAHWMAVASEDSVSCGGAHPSAGTSVSLWNLDTGKTVDTWTWFNDKGAKYTVTDAGKKSQYGTVTIAPALRKALADGWKANDEDCKDIGETQDYWQAWPAKNGFVFRPDLPHVIYACTDDVVIPYDKIMGLLNGEGVKAVKAIRAELAQPRPAQ